MVTAFLLVLFTVTNEEYNSKKTWNKESLNNHFGVWPQCTSLLVIYDVTLLSLLISVSYDTLH